MEPAMQENVDKMILQIMAQLDAVVNSATPEIVGLWAELWDEDERDKRMSILGRHCAEELKKILENITIKEREEKAVYIERVETLLEEIVKLEEQLSVKIPYEDVASLPLHIMAMRLNQKAEKFRVIREERLTELKNLCRREAELADALGVSQTTIDQAIVPSNEQLEIISRNVTALETEKLARTMVFIEKREKIRELFRLLGETPRFNDKDFVLDDREHDFKVTQENMEQLDKILKRLEADVEYAKERRENFVRQLNAMWSYLEEPLENQEKFMAEHASFTVEDLGALMSELERCKIEKSANIGKFVERAREELVVEWDKCMVSEEIRSQFRPFHITTYSEDVYDVHEIELNRWRNYYTRNKDIFDLLARHKVLFEKLQELDGRGKNSNRYHNRGGQLLQEERQRKTVAKELPRVEEQLRSALANYNEVNGSHFCAFGKPLEQVLDEQWSAHFDQKIIDKFRNGGSVKKMPRTPMALKRCATGTVSSSTEPKMSRMLAPPKSTSRPATRARVQLYRQKSDMTEVNKTFHLEETYDDFQKTLNKKVTHNKMVSRSTEVLTPSKILRERNNNPGLITMQSAPIVGTPKWTTVRGTPKTVPRAAKRPGIQSQPNLTPAKNRLPVIL